MIAIILRFVTAGADRNALLSDRIISNSSLLEIIRFNFHLTCNTNKSDSTRKSLVAGCTFKSNLKKEIVITLESYLFFLSIFKAM